MLRGRDLPSFPATRKSNDGKFTRLQQNLFLLEGIPRWPIVSVRAFGSVVDEALASVSLVVLGSFVSPVTSIVPHSAIASGMSLLIEMMRFTSISDKTSSVLGYNFEAVLVDPLHVPFGTPCARIFCFSLAFRPLTNHLIQGLLRFPIQIRFVSSWTMNS